MQPVEGRASCGSPEASQIMANSQETTPRTRKYAGLQVLRIIAAFMVLVMHSMFFASERLKPGFHIWGPGATGVDIFFVLSGFYCPGCAAVAAQTAPYTSVALGGNQRLPGLGGGFADPLVH
jgi:hypothetical protein